MGLLLKEIEEIQKTKDFKYNKSMQKIISAVGSRHPIGFGIFQCYPKEKKSKSKRKSNN
jgi:hypothetical protein